MKHVDCTCAECRPRATAVQLQAIPCITIPLAEAPAVIADSVRAELAANGLAIVRSGFNVATSLDGKELADFLRVLANNITSALQGLDEEPAPALPVRTGARR